LAHIDNSRRNNEEDDREDIGKQLKLLHVRTKRVVAIDVGLFNGAGDFRFADCGSHGI
jgi:hypothetical protein